MKEDQRRLDALATWLYTKYSKFSSKTAKEEINWITNRSWPLSPLGALAMKEVYTDAREIIRDGGLVTAKVKTWKG